MKKLKTLFFMLAIFATSAYPADNFEPKWEDVAPVNYKNVTFIENNTFFKKYPIYSELINCTIIGSPVYAFMRKKSEEVEANNYWVGRKNEFEAQKNLCLALKGDKKIECFLNLRRNELLTTQAKERTELLERMEKNQRKANFLQAEQNYNNSRTKYYTINGNTIMEW